MLYYAKTVFYERILLQVKLLCIHSASIGKCYFFNGQFLTSVVITSLLGYISFSTAMLHTRIFIMIFD